MSSDQNPVTTGKQFPGWEVAKNGKTIYQYWDRLPEDIKKILKQENGFRLAKGDREYYVKKTDNNLFIVYNNEKKKKNFFKKRKKEFIDILPTGTLERSINKELVSKYLQDNPQAELDHAELRNLGNGQYEIVYFFIEYQKE